MSRHSRVVRGLVLFLLLAVRPAWGNVPPQAEGIPIFFSSIPAFLVALRLMFPKTRTATLIVSGILLFLGGPVPECLLAAVVVALCLVGMALLLSRGPDETPSARRRRHAGIFLMLYCVAAFAVALSSINYFWGLRNHERLQRTLESAAAAARAGCDAHGVYPATLPADVLALPRIYGDLPGRIVYEPDPDRRQFRIFYDGNYFSEAFWYRLPSQRPQVRSDTGLDPGMRIAPWRQLFGIGP